MLRSVSVPLHEQYCWGLKLAKEEELSAEKEKLDAEVEILNDSDPKILDNESLTDLNGSSFHRPSRRSAQM